MMKKFLPLAILALLVAFAVCVRFTPIIAERDLWYDEAFTGILLKAPWGEMNQMIFADVHPPLYYWLAKPWSAMFAYSPEGIRSFSLFMGLLTIVSVYWIGKKMFGVRAGLLAAAITTISPFAIEYSQEARMYSLFGLFFVWAIWFFYRALEDDEMRHWVLWGVFSGLAFLTHYLSLFFFIMFYVCYVLYKRIFASSSWKAAILGHRNFWLGVGTIFLFFLSWLKYFIPHMLKGNLGWIGPAQLSDLLKTLQIFFFGHQPGTGGVPESTGFNGLYKDIPPFDGTSAGLLIFTVMLIMFIYAWSKFKERKEIFILAMLSVGTLLFLILLSHVNLKLYVSRYFMPAAVLVYILFSGLVVQIFAKSKWAWIGAFVIYIGMLSLLNPIRYTSGWDQVSDFMHKGEVFSADTIIVTDNPFNYTSARYYFGEDRVRYYNRNNPTEDFGKWVVVGNHNRLTELSAVKEFEKVVVVDWTCDWGAELEMEETVRMDQLAVCLVRK